MLVPRFRGPGICGVAIETISDTCCAGVDASFGVLPPAALEVLAVIACEPSEAQYYRYDDGGWSAVADLTEPVGEATVTQG